MDRDQHRRGLGGLPAFANTGDRIVKRRMHLVKTLLPSGTVQSGISGDVIDLAARRNTVRGVKRAVAIIDQTGNVTGHQRRVQGI